MNKNNSVIARKLFFGNPDQNMPYISPDGKYMAYLAPLEGVVNAWVYPVQDVKSAHPVTSEKNRPIRMYQWAYTSRHILYLQDKAGDENFHIYATNVATGQTIDLTPYDNIQAQIANISPESPKEILVLINDRNPQTHDLYRINIETAERSLVYQNDQGFMRFVTTAQYELRLAGRMTPDGGAQFLELTPAGEWREFLQLPADDSMTTQPLAFDASGENLYLIDSLNRNTSAMMLVNMRTRKSTLLAEDDRSDVNDQIIHPITHQLQAVAFNYERKTWKVLDTSIQGDIDFLSMVANGEMEILSRSADDQFWTVFFLMDNGPLRFYLYDRKAHQAIFLFSSRKELEGLPLAKMHPAVVKARDGLELVCYYSLPAEFGDAKTPDRPLPMVMWIHGGPWARDEWGYNSFHQLFANRGYAVMSVNYRGSTGLGKKYLNAGNLEWAGKMHDDLIDALKWAIENKIADPQKVAISGGSYGGYATLVGVTFTPDVFTCGVDIVGPSNLVTLIESIPPYWAPMIEVFAKRMGDHRTEEGRKLLMERSPLTRAARIKKPLLIAQGANDPRVKQAESDQIVKAMEENNIPVTYVLYNDEGHGFARPENSISFIAIAEAFLAKQLGGRCEPIADAFNKANFKILSGADDVPGLPEALR